MKNLAPNNNSITFLVLMLITIGSFSPLIANDGLECRYSFSETKKLLKPVAKSYEDRVDNLVRRIYNFERKATEMLSEAVAKPGDLIEQSDLLITEIYNLLKERGEAVRLVKEELVLRNEDRVGSTPNLKQEYLLIRLPVDEIPAGSIFRFFHFTKFRTEVVDISIDILGNVLIGANGFYSPKVFELGLGSYSISNSLLTSSLRDYVISHELTHSILESKKLWKRTIYEAYVLAKRKLKKDLHEESTTLPFNQIEEMYTDLNENTKEMEMLLNKDLRFRGSQMFSIQFYNDERIKSEVENANYENFLSSDEIYTHANNVWWLISAISNPEKLSGSKLFDLTRESLSLIQSLQYTALLVNQRSKAVIKEIRKISKQDLDQILNQQVGFDAEDGFFYIYFYTKLKNKTTRLKVMKDFYSVNSIRAIFEEYQRRWSQNKVGVSTSEEWAPDFSVTNIKMSKTLDKMSLERLLEEMYSEVLVELSQLEKISAFYILESFRFLEDLYAFSNLFALDNAYSQKHLSKKTLRSFYDLKQKARQLGLWVRPGYKNFVGKKDLKIDQKELRKKIKELQTDLLL